MEFFLHTINPISYAIASEDADDSGRDWHSHGLMVNYLYRLDDIENNHEAYAEGGTIAASPALRKLARPLRLEAN